MVEISVYLRAEEDRTEPGIQPASVVRFARSSWSTSSISTRIGSSTVAGIMQRQPNLDVQPVTR